LGFEISTLVLVWNFGFGIWNFSQIFIFSAFSAFSAVKMPGFGVLRFSSYIISDWALKGIKPALFSNGLGGRRSKYKKFRSGYRPSVALFDDSSTQGLEKPTFALCLSA
jgi:hypothetical protein